MFFKINDNITVNLNKIRQIDVAGEKVLRITFDNGDMEVYCTDGVASCALDRLGRTV